ncbi:glycosyltransferase [Chryseobacterium sp. JUb7]|uniref:glycosyltransferase n=1 Tax=Chryseobacterium sp. JUb7 TaxID=2940599 RepID=UPI00216914A0|nr:glycosyltransferase [Chryseobacterium sp. JUb7]MCS3531760.1 GT2 family glycosyltransferase [Chryseobacterium sp. JUb7]
MILFGIVTYRERFWECKSFKSLYHSFKKDKGDDKIHIFIFDNTDIEDWDLTTPTFQDIKLEYTNDKRNPGISCAYNTIAEYARQNDYNYITFLDQDTELPDNFYEVYKNYSLKDYSLCVPQIHANNRLVSPSRYINFRSVLYENLNTDELVLKGNSCINTGMMIKNEIFFMNKGYNSALRLDFCDHEFIERLSKFDLKMKIIPIIINQNFSFLDNTKKQDVFRYKLFIKDLKTYANSTNKQLKMFFYVDLPRLLSLTLRHKSLEFLKIRLRS